ncbi:hypothetical protein BDY24DRAFT_393807 [Mrakia frigida]|uniref:uncharacterized protein n=1 Tax=Mrakia frigida TaxID=29902 RepID=UPI003FCC0D09
MIRTISEAKIDFRTLSDVDRFSQAVNMLPYNFASGDRFVREHPSEAVAYHLHLLAAIANIPEHVFESSSVVAHNSFYRILTGVGLSHDSLLLGYPDPVIPVPRPSVLEQTALHRLERLAPLSPQNAIDPVPTKTVADVFTLGDMNVGMGSRYRAPDIGKRWWTCDLKRENKSVSCVDAEEMMACGRCFNVRYCSGSESRRARVSFSARRSSLSGLTFAFFLDFQSIRNSIGNSTRNCASNRAGEMRSLL